MIRVNRITVTLDVYVEFEGSHTTTFSYEPSPDDALANLAVAKNDAILLAAVPPDKPVDV